MNKEQLPSLSVIMVACNQEKALDHTLFQLLKQTMIEQFILIDCDSIDNTRQRLFYFADSDERCEVYHFNDQDKVAAFNFGLTKATGEMVMFLEADMMMSHLGRLLLDARLDNADIVIQSAQLPSHHQTNVVAMPELLDMLPLYGTLFRRQFLQKFSLTFNQGSDWALMFKAMTLLAAERVAIIHSEDDLLHYETPWYEAGQVRDWKHFLYSMTWLLKAAEPLPSVREVLMTYILTTALTQMMEALLHRHADIDDIKEAMTFYAQWLNDNAIQPSLVTLSPRFQLLYQALMNQSFNVFYTLWSGPQREPLMIKEHRYQSTIAWHNPLLTTDEGMTGNVRLSSQKEKDQFILSGDIELEQDLPLLDASVTVQLVNTLYQTTVDVDARLHHRTLTMMVNTSRLQEAPGEWELNIQLKTGNALVTMTPQSAIEEVQTLVFEKQTTELHLKDRVWFYVPEWQVMTQFERIHLEYNQLYLFLDDDRPLNLCLVNEENEEVIVGELVEYEGQQAFCFERPQMTEGHWQFIVMGYQHQKNWWRLVNEHPIFGTFSLGEWDFRWVFDETASYIDITLASTPLVACEEHDGKLALTFDMTRYDELGFKPTALLFDNDSENQRYVIPLSKEKVVIEIYNEHIWHMESGSYTLKLQYHKDDEAIMTAIVGNHEMIHLSAHHMKGALYSDSTHSEWDVTRCPQSPTMKRWLRYLYPLYRWLPLEMQTVTIMARQVNENMKDVATLLVDKGYHVQWIVSSWDEQSELPNDVTTIFEVGSAKAWRALATSRYIIDDAFISQHFGKRKAQVLMHLPAFDETEQIQRLTTAMAALPQKTEQDWQRQLRHIDIWVTSSQEQQQQLQEQFNYNKDAVAIGLPIEEEIQRYESVKALRTRYHLPMDKKVLALDLRHQSHLQREMLWALYHDYVILVSKATPLPLVNRDEQFIVTYQGEWVDFYRLADVLVTDNLTSARTYALLQRPCLLYQTKADGFKTVENESDLVHAIFNQTEWLVTYQQQARRLAEGRYATSHRTEALVDALLSVDNRKARSESIIFRPLMKQAVHWLYEQLFAFVGLFPAKDVMIFESFYGKQYSDNPKALYQYAKEHYPNYRLIWNAKKGHEAVFKEAGVPYVVNNSIAGLWWQARAKYWIQNTRMVEWKQPPKHTTVLQTWHGTPWKRLGLDIENVTMPGVTTEEYRQSFKQDTEKWSYLIAPNAYSLNIFRSAFDYPTTQMIPSGYPRNDRLYQPSEDEIIRLKEELHLPQDKTIILYAPTWRDNENKGQGKYEMTLAIDLDRWRQAFGDDVILLVRSHYFIQHDVCQSDEWVRDVSRYPDISDLYLVSDMLITDYSSAFFDYGLLKRPMIFFAYDEEDYCQTTRGFYFDYHTVPGHIVHDNEALIHEVKAQIKEPHLHENYPAFYETYLSWEDGHASERVFEMMMNHESWTVEKDPMFFPHEAVLTGTGKAYQHEGNMVSLSEQRGRQVTLEVRYMLKDPCQHHVMGESYYEVTLDDHVLYISSDDMIVG